MVMLLTSCRLPLKQSKADTKIKNQLFLSECIEACYFFGGGYQKSQSPELFAAIESAANREFKMRETGLEPARYC